MALAAGKQGVSTRPRGRRLHRAAGIGVLLLAGAGLVSSAAFNMQVGMTRKQRGGTLRNKANLPPVLELPVEEPEPEDVIAEEPLDRRVPYKLHIVTQFPGSTNPNVKYIERKVVGALEHAESLITHVEVRLVYQENFHREKIGRTRQGGSHAAHTGANDFSEEVSTEDGLGYEAVTPYQFKVVVSLKNHHKLVLSNPEKHAQATFTEATDHMADVLRKMLREEKEKEVRLWRKRHRDEKVDAFDSMDVSDEERMLMDWVDEKEAAAAEDAQMERLYKAVEGRAGSAAARDAAAELSKAVDRAVVQSYEGGEKKVQTGGLRNLILSDD